MSGESLPWIGLLAFLILCCVLPMLLMMRRGRGAREPDNGSDTAGMKMNNMKDATIPKMKP